MRDAAGVVERSRVSEGWLLIMRTLRVIASVNFGGDGLGAPRARAIGSRGDQFIGWLGINAQYCSE